MEGKKIYFFYNRIGYPTEVNSDLNYFISHKYVKIKVDSYNLLPLKKALTFHVIMLIKSVFNSEVINLKKNIGFTEKKGNKIKHKNYKKLL